MKQCRRLMASVALIVSGCSCSPSYTENNDLQMRVTSFFPHISIGNVATSMTGSSYHLATIETNNQFRETRKKRSKLENGTRLRINRVDTIASTLSSSVLSDQSYAFTAPVLVNTPDGVIVIGTSTRPSEHGDRAFAYAVWLDAKGALTKTRHIVSETNVFAMDGARAADGSLIVGVSHAGELRVQDPDSPDAFPTFGDKADSAAYTLLRFDSDGKVVSHLTWNDRRDLDFDSCRMKIRMHADGSVSALMLFVNENNRGWATDYEWRLAQIDTSNKVLSITPIWQTINDVEMEATNDGGVITLLYVELGAFAFNTHGLQQHVESNGGSDSWSLALLKGAPSGKTEWITVSGYLSWRDLSADLAVSLDDGSMYLATVFSKAIKIESTGSAGGMSVKGPENSLALFSIDEKGIVRFAEVLCHSVDSVQDIQYVAGGKLLLVVTSRGKPVLDGKVRGEHSGILKFENDAAAPLSTNVLEIDLTDKKDPVSTPHSKTTSL